MKTENGKHTPGPWYVRGLQSGVTEYSDTRHIYAPADDNTGCVANVVSSDANAALIAAAPDMLEALRACVERMAELQKHTSYPLAWPRTMAYEAIRKATGEQ